MLDSKGQANPALIVLAVLLIIGLIVALFILPREDDADVEIDLGSASVAVQPVEAGSAVTAAEDGSLASVPIQLTSAPRTEAGRT